MIAIFLSLTYVYTYILKERGGEKRKLGVVVVDTTLGVGSRKKYVPFRRSPGSGRYTC
jgi:hypothetical protein